MTLGITRRALNSAQRPSLAGDGRAIRGWVMPLSEAACIELHQRMMAKQEGKDQERDHAQYTPHRM